MGFMYFAWFVLRPERITDVTLLTGRMNEDTHPMLSKAVDMAINRWDLSLVYITFNKIETHMISILSIISL